MFTPAIVLVCNKRLFPSYPLSVLQLLTVVLLITPVTQFLLFPFKLFYEMYLDRCQLVLCPLFELVIFSISLCLGELCGNSSGMCQDVLARYTQEIIKNRNPVFHIHRSVLLCLKFCKVEIEADDTV